MVANPQNNELDTKQAVNVRECVVFCYRMKETDDCMTHGCKNTAANACMQRVYRQRVR